jgi:hypothetical protein
MESKHTTMRHYLTVAAIIIATAPLIWALTNARKGPIVRQADRLLIESGNPEPLFSFFSDDLQLPIAWPLSENQGYMSGALGAGNVTIEIFRYARSEEEKMNSKTAARFAGLALEPYPLEEALRELKAEKIPYGSPQNSISILPDGTKGVVSTTVPLPSFSKSPLSVFLFEYSPAFLQVDVRRKQMGNRLTLNRGGPLGIRSMHEIVLSASNFEESRAAWQRLLGRQTDPGYWKLGSGPAIRLIPGSKDKIQRIVVQVRSLAQAKSFLKENNLLGTLSTEEISIKPSRIQGLIIALAE